MISRIVRKYRAGGLKGIRDALAVRLIPPAPSPVRIGLDAIVAGDHFTIIQIGAHVGNTANDPLFAIVRKKLMRSQGRLICIEPVKEHFEQLVKNYQGIPNVAFEQVAIADTTGPATFYRLGVNPVDHGFPEWLSQLGSLKSERMGELWDQVESNQQYKAFYMAHRVTDTVQCITFADLLRRQNVSRVDLLQIDTEGYELEILRTINFQQTPIRFVNYEYTLLLERKPEAERLMRQNGYSLIDHGQDTFCYKASEGGTGDASSRRAVRRLKRAAERASH